MWGSPWRSHLDLEQAPELFSNGHVWETETDSHGANAAAASCGTHVGAATAAMVPLPSAAPSSEAQGGSSEAATAVEEAVAQPSSELRMPTAAELAAHIAQLVQLHGAREIVLLALRDCSPEIMQEACDLAWGVRSDGPGEQLARVRAYSHP